MTAHFLALERLRRWASVRHQQRIEAAHRREVFRRAYVQGKQSGWESVSGPGSSLAATRAVADALPGLLRDLGTRVLLDAPCGDFRWMKEVDLAGIKYLGVDIVPEVIAANRRRYGAPGRTFRVLDLVQDVPPRADLVLCRDCLVHLSFPEVKSIMRNLKRSGSTFLLTTIFPSRDQNENVVTGGWRPLNLEAPPLNFPPPLRLICEEYLEHGGAWADKSMGLWNIRDLPD